MTVSRNEKDMISPWKLMNWIIFGEDIQIEPFISVTRFKMVGSIVRCQTELEVKLKTRPVRLRPEV